MFVCEDIITMDDRSVQRFLRDCDPRDVVLSLKAANSDVANKLFSNMSTRMVQNIKDAGIPSALSYTAGSYVCNYLMYTLLYLIDRKYPNIRGGFIHVPYAMEQVVNKPLGTPSMDLHQIARGLEKAVEAVVKNDADPAVNMGTTH